MSDETERYCINCGGVLDGASRRLWGEAHATPQTCIQNLRAELATLREQLAAHEWRPISEPPETVGVYQTFTMSPILADHAIYESDGTWSYRYARPDFWRPVTPPDATEE